jgi:hypothetical protein
MRRNSIIMNGVCKFSLHFALSSRICRTSLLFALSSLLFVSCSQEEFLYQETDADAVKVVASISNLQTRVA